MKKILFKRQENCYKANLHTHTDISDGAFTPEEVKEAYKEAGYQIVAFTDHEIMIPHPELCDENFLAMNSYELFINEPLKDLKRRRKTYHLNFYCPDNEERMFPLFKASHIWFCPLEHLAEILPKEMFQIETVKDYSIEGINNLIRVANEKGYLVSYNHPVWSQQDYSDYHGLKGLWGVEWFNTGCDQLGYVDDIKPIDDLLREGERVFPLATDDSHGDYDRFGGWCMVNAASLTHKDVFESLKKGDFYSTTGPDIFEISKDGNIVTVKTSPVRHISITTERRYAKRQLSEDGSPITEASFNIVDLLKEMTDERTYIRITVQDMEGNRAYSRAFFSEDFT